MKVTLKAIVEGGKASFGPPLGPLLSSGGLSPQQVIPKINELTKEFSGMKVPIEIEIDKETKQYELKVGMPFISEELKKIAGIEKGFGDRSNSVSIPFEKIKELASKRIKNSISSDEKKVINEILGTCLSIGIKVENKDPREFIS
ncbi:MAG: 50S ribosomal protein L11 [Candidatus Rehaiarchaeum fermentans]|nr:50S ribosomal protein L11 [Candidatus Rehaiarchaeum fermentans]MCW1292839.1 50S ribosomal protein L11 [Candidatus Rehaiarchaeum fermentans]MCW1311324.1 50S ribosomal protein L11 [Candidatus Rehaiarchaeum fermentans]